MEKQGGANLLTQSFPPVPELESGFQPTAEGITGGSAPQGPRCRRGRGSRALRIGEGGVTGSHSGGRGHGT